MIATNRKVLYYDHGNQDILGAEGVVGSPEPGTGVEGVGGVRGAGVRGVVGTLARSSATLVLVRRCISLS